MESQRSQEHLRRDWIKNVSLVSPGLFLATPLCARRELGASTLLAQATWAQLVATLKLRDTQAPPVRNHAIGIFCFVDPVPYIQSKG